MPNLSKNTAILMILGFGICVATALTVIDYSFDPEDAELSDFIADLVQNLVLVGAMVASAFFVFRISTRVSHLEHETHILRRDLGQGTTEGEAWRKQSKLLMEGLSTAIRNQFDDWSLRPAESDIAGLMLKGLSTKEISALRETSDVTIRQQAPGIYKKSNLSYRAELSAFCLEDLLDIPQSISQSGSSDSSWNQIGQKA